MSVRAPRRRALMDRSHFSAPPGAARRGSLALTFSLVCIAPTHHRHARCPGTMQTRFLMGDNELARVRMQDVARRANVSVATVSRALSGAAGMSPATRARILTIASALGFRRNEIARSLKSRSSRTIGFLTDDIEGVFTMLILRGLEDLATTMGFNVFLCNSYDDAERERSHLNALLAKQVDGLVLSSGYKVRRRAAPAAPTGTTPLVFAYQYTNDVAVHCVLPDDFGGGSMAAKHLVEVGRRRIGVIAGPKHYDASTLRLKGARHALRQHGMNLPPHRVRQGLKWHEDVGYQLAAELMAQDPPPDGLFCMSDNLAVGALAALKELGFSVPDDVSLVGFDDRYGATHTRPPLTTVALPLYEIGRFAGQLLIEQLTGQATPPESPTLHRLACSLVERGSSRPGASTASGPEPPPPSTTHRPPLKSSVARHSRPHPKTNRSTPTPSTGGSYEQ
jgi:LacI family transcriptional regulator